MYAVYIYEVYILCYKNHTIYTKDDGYNTKKQRTFASSIKKSLNIIP